MNSEHTHTWPDLAIGLYDRLTGSNAEISYEFSDMKVQIPSGTGDDATHARWILNGTVKISTSQKTPSPN
jgi:hypothetical protein